MGGYNLFQQCKRCLLYLSLLDVARVKIPRSRPKHCQNQNPKNQDFIMTNIFKLQLSLWMALIQYLELTTPLWDSGVIYVSYNAMVIIWLKHFATHISDCHIAKMSLVKNFLDFCKISKFLQNFKIFLKFQKFWHFWIFQKFSKISKFPKSF